MSNTTSEPSGDEPVEKLYRVKITYEVYAVGTSEDVACMNAHDEVRHGDIDPNDEHAEEVRLPTDPRCAAKPEAWVGFWLDEVPSGASDDRTVRDWIEALPAADQTNPPPFNPIQEATK